MWIIACFKVGCVFSAFYECVFGIIIIVIGDTCPCTVKRKVKMEAVELLKLMWLTAVWNVE
jgi:hypothetical protein